MEKAVVTLTNWELYVYEEGKKEIAEMENMRIQELAKQYKDCV